MVSVAELVWPIRRPRPEGIEDIAAMIAAGKAPSAAEIVAVLDAARCSEADLQKAVDRHRRVTELRREIADAGAARKRFATLDAKVRAADADIEKASAARDALLATVGREYTDCRIRADAATRAEEALLDPANLSPGDAARIAEAEKAAAAASMAAVAARDELAACRRSLQDAEGKLPVAEQEAQVNPNVADIQAEATRLRLAVKARGERVTAAEAALATADTALVEANRRLADINAAIRKAVIG